MPQTKKGGSVDLASAAVPLFFLTGKMLADKSASDSKKKGKKPASSGRRRIRGGAGGEDVPAISGTPTLDLPGEKDGMLSIQSSTLSAPPTQSAVSGMYPTSPATEYSSTGGARRKRVPAKKTHKKKVGGSEEDMAAMNEITIGGAKSKRAPAKGKGKRKQRGGGDGDGNGEIPTVDGQQVTVPSEQPPLPVPGDQQPTLQPLEVASPMAGGRRKVVKRNSKPKRGGSGEEDEQRADQDGGAKRKRKSKRGGSNEVEEQEGGAKRKPKRKTPSRKLRGGALEMYSQQLQELTQGLKDLLV